MEEDMKKTFSRTSYAAPRWVSIGCNPTLIPSRPSRLPGKYHLQMFGYFAILPIVKSKSQPRTVAAPRSLAEYRAGASVFKALGHPSRLLIVDALSHGELCVAELTERIGCDISTVSNHLSVLRNAGLVLDERRGQQVFYSLGAPCVTKVFSCMEELRAAREKQP